MSNSTNGPLGHLTGPQGLTRRGFLGAAGVSAAGLLLASCSPETGGGEGPGTSGGTDLKEAPDLTAKVESGELPPLADRLPKNPLVVNYVDGPGVYGGTWRAASVSNDGGWMLQRVTGHTYLVRWDPDYTEILPDLAESWEMSEDASELRFQLREGVKWSDGEPFTSADIEFAVNDVMYHPKVNPAAETKITAAADGDFAVVLKLEPANGLYLQNMAGPGRNITAIPKHYISQFHADFNDDVDSLVKEAGLQDWVELLTAKGGFGDTPRLNAVDLPVLTPWVLTEAPGAAGTKVGFSRNPFFFKTDPDGRQLPYIDKVEFSIIDEPEVMVTAAANGEIDMQNRTFNIPRNKPVLAESRESGGYGFFDMPSTFMNTTVLGLNQTATNSVAAEAFGNKDFRIGFSHAINRQEIIDVVFQRQGEPWQAAPRRETRFFDEEFAKQYTEFDLELAKQQFDKAGYEADASGARLWKDGSKLSVSLLVSNFKPEWVDVAELLRGQLAEAGIDLRVDAVDRTLFNERVNANEHEIAVWQGDGGGNDLFLDSRWYFPFNVQNSLFGTTWAQWYVSNGAEGEEPPAAPKKQIELYRELLASGDQTKQDELMTEILAIAKEEFYAIGIHLPGDGYGIVKNNFHNVPKVMIDSYYWSGPGPTNPEQYFIEG
ncbi:ABC transporter substrate-binding protein [Microlunatus sp. Y2014]|uniref:ABC transporter substrate-binding protein n=1 Tax=Microlunatus sp. Y2014 TaxID=3418488 RepID=UPI003DA6F55E